MKEVLHITEFLNYYNNNKKKIKVEFYNDDWWIWSEIKNGKKLNYILNVDNNLVIKTDKIYL